MNLIGTKHYFYSTLRKEIKKLRNSECEKAFLKDFITPNAAL